MRNSSPPQILLRLLKWFCKPAYHADIEGDLLEFYERRVAALGRKRANWLLFKDVFKLFRPGLVRSFGPLNRPNLAPMLQHNLIMAFRNSMRHKMSFFINVTGLSIGITCSILILLWVADESSFDKFHPKADRLYQVWANVHIDGAVNSSSALPLPTYEELKISDSNIKRALVTDWGNDHLVSSGSDTHLNKKGYYVSEEFLEMFEFPLLKGNPEIALDDPLSIVITESTARALFGEEDPMGKIVRVDNEHDLKVSGILKDVPTNSSFQFDVLMTWKFQYQISNMVRHNTTDWSETAYQIYVELNDPASQATVENSIRDMIAKHGEVDVKRELFLYPLLRWRLYSNFNNGRESGGMIDYVTMFSILAFFIIVMACINFMNLATARSERRAREVGIRKSVGSRRFELVLQFISESTLVTLFSFVIAVLLAQLLLPAYNSLVQKQLFIDYLSTTFWLYAIALIVLMGVVSGSYPAFYLSSFQPMKVLKGKPTTGKGASLPRKILVTLQFGFSILMIIGTIVIYRQIQLVKGRNLGYDKENLITVEYNNDIKNNFKPLKLDLLSSGVVEAVVRSNLSITQANSSNYLGWPGMPEGLLVDFTTISTDYDWTKTMGIKVIEGRDFSEEFKSDTAAILVNKAAIKLMGLKDPIGTQLDLWDNKWTLIGVVDDVLMGSVYHAVEPMLAVNSTGWINRVTIRLKKTDDLQASLKTVESIFKKHAPAYPFDYTFVDGEFQKKFTTINLTSQLSGLFGSLAIIITGLGLFGLATFTAEQRTKEIGIRKVLGASVTSVINLLARDFSVLVIVSFVLASPLAWWTLTTYLERYPIRTEINWWIFPLTGLITLVFALLIVLTQTWRAARANPVNSLRSE